MPQDKQLPPDLMKEVLEEAKSHTTILLWSETSAVEAADAMYWKMQEDRIKAIPKESEFAVMILDIIRENIRAVNNSPAGIYVSGKKETADKIAFLWDAFMNAVYEGASMWEEKYNDKKKELTPLQEQVREYRARLCLLIPFQMPGQAKTIQELLNKYPQK